MPSLLDLTTQGDVATMSDESQPLVRHAHDPAAALRLWERQNWGSQEIDFTQDRRDWEAMDPVVRDQIAWGLSRFFVGEERVTTQFSGLVMAYDDQHEEAFLTTQQVDEARHAQHFNSLWEQVLAARRHLRAAPRRLPRHAQRGLLPPLRRACSSTPTARSSSTRATSRPRSTSS